jgi:hypothetical protein
MVWHGFVQFIFYLSIIRSPTSSHQGPADWSGWPHDAGEVQDVDGPVQFMGKCCVFFMGNKWRMTVDPWMLYSMVSNPRVKSKLQKTQIFHRKKDSWGPETSNFLGIRKEAPAAHYFGGSIGVRGRGPVGWIIEDPAIFASDDPG